MSGPLHAWKRDEFTMLVRGEKGPRMMRVAGVVDGVFGLDRRKCYDLGDRRTGYVVTHLKTGYSVRHMACNIKQAKEAVALLHAADWDFNTPEEAALSPERMETVKAVNRLGFCVGPGEFETAVEVPA
jgi:hypothetical protein